MVLILQTLLLEAGEEAASITAPSATHAQGLLVQPSHQCHENTSSFAGGDPVKGRLTLRKSHHKILLALLTARDTLHIPLLMAKSAFIGHSHLTRLQGNDRNLARSDP